MSLQRDPHMPRFVHGLAAVLALLAPLAAKADDIAATFVCEGGVVLDVTFQEASATLVQGDITYTLPQQVTASGYLYQGDGVSLQGKGSDATYTDAAGVEIQCRDQTQAMQEPQIQPPVVSLEGTHWRLVYFQSMDDAIGTIIPPRVENYTAQFLAGGKLALQLDCNRLSAGWAQDGSGLTLTGGPMTRAFCGEGALDSQIARDLEYIRSFVLVDGQLAMALQADAGIYLWEPISP
jgi:heat shock protein HslJ